ncbi:MAG: hypothetical protein EKK40_04275 [Bradyrhizobiaceae bacterium]|nr:MAG: hypothetical protein EKK40_04275 [Bradyrhizobiaceae bacterium]
MTIGFPLLLIPLAIYNIVVFLMPGVSFTAAVANVRLMSGADWPMTFGDLLLACGLFLLLLEAVKAARPGAKYLTDHLLSLLVFAAALAEFLLLGPFGTSTFFLLTVMMAVEFLTGTVNALRHRKYRAADDAPVDSHDLPQDDQLERPSADVPAGTRGPPPSHPPLVAPRAEPEMPSPSASPAVPPVEKISPAIHEDSVGNIKPGRKISEWSVSDLVRDSDHADQREAAPVKKTSEQ